MAEVVERGAELAAVDGSAIVAGLRQHYPPHIVRAVLAQLAGIAGNAPLPPSLALDPVRIARTRALAMFAVDATWPCQAFLDAWAEWLPAGVASSLHLLGGIAVTVGTKLQHLPPHSLPTEAFARFAALFDVKPVWTLAEIESYCRAVQMPGQSTDEVLMRNCLELKDQSVKGVGSSKDGDVVVRRFSRRR